MRLKRGEILVGCLGVMALLSITVMAQDVPIGNFDNSKDIDNGRLGAAGSALYDATGCSYIMQGSGDDVWNEADAFRFAYKEWKGDFVFMSDIGVDGGKSDQVWIKSMLMARQDITPGAVNTCTRIRRDGQYSMQWRKIAGDTNSKGSTDSAKRPVIPLFSRQKLERKGNLFTTSYLDAKGAWVVVDSQEIVMKDPILVGPAVCAHDTGYVATGTFKNTILASPIAGTFNYSADIGEKAKLGAEGSGKFDSGVYTITGSGDDIWNDKDAFHFMWTEMSGDFDVSADVTIDGGKSDQVWIKSMIMVRQDQSPGAAHLGTRIRRDGQYSMQWRNKSYDTAAIGSTDSAKRPVLAAKPWRNRLVKQGKTFTTYYLNEKKEWIKVDAHDLVLTEPYLVGLAVTSHDTGQVATGTFSNLEVINTPAASKVDDWDIFR